MANLVLTKKLSLSDFPNINFLEAKQISPSLTQGLYAQGTEKAFQSLLPLLPHQGLTIVGTRKAYSECKKWITQVFLELKSHSNPLIILSGLARGIDHMAHEIALAHGLPTIAIMGTSLEHTYPPEHFELRKKILAQNGLILTELRSHEKTYPAHFVKRNRWLAFLSQATWVVQAPEKSGALITAQWAIDFNRDVYVTPCFPNQKNFLGNERLLQEGAIPLWNTTSLKSTWAELLMPSKKQKTLDTQSNDLETLVGFLPEEGASLQELLQYSQSLNWDLKKLTQILELGIKHKIILDENGHILKNN